MSPSVHRALISDLGDPFLAQAYRPESLWWPGEDLLLQGYGDGRMSFGIWDPETLSGDGKHLARAVYDEKAKKDPVQLYTFPDGKLLWSKALGARRFAFAEGCPWLFGGTSFRLKGLTRYLVKKIDLATGEVLEVGRTTRKRKEPHWPDQCLGRV
ncbi:MAG: hypothetical protein P1U82_05380 [Verrucomicrobiales bacterium]|nr:hypothetical protein [Verrucomicrobiales bacterium]